MFTNMLSWWQWSIVGAIPAAVLALYFLKLKRTPLEVPSTFLWHKSIEDLHVNSIWQKLRNNILLWLQLLLLLFAILALLNPTSQGSQLVGSRFIFVLDVSASMQSRDVTREGEQISRLDAGKAQVRALVDSMPADSVSMLISFSDTAQVLQPFTDKPNNVVQALDQAQPTNKTTILLEALRVSAGLSNPTRTGSEEQDRIKAAAMPAKVYILSDGKLEKTDFAWGALEPEYRRIGASDARNLAITSFSVARNETNATTGEPGTVEAFVNLDNFGPEEETVLAELHLALGNSDDFQLLDAVRVRIPGRTADGAGGLSLGPPATRGITFDVPEITSGVLELRIRNEATSSDDLAVDDRAWVVVDNPELARVLLITATKNNPLELALTTPGARELIYLEIVNLEDSPDYLQSDDYRLKSLSGLFDLIIFDRCVPPDRPAPEGSDDAQPTQMPLCNTLWIGAAPKLQSWGWSPQVESWPPPIYNAPPRIIDTDRAHPIMSQVELGNVAILDAFGMAAPAGGRTLIDSDMNAESGSGLLTIGPRDAFEDVIMSFDLFNDGGPNTNWPIRDSFPVQILNLARYLGSPRDALSLDNVRPGEPVELKIDAAAGADLTVHMPDGETLTVTQTRQQTYVITRTDELGVYKLYAGTDLVARFAVNLFNPLESDIPASDDLQFSYEPLAAAEVEETTKVEWWKWLVVLALVVLIVEWYIYNRRVAV